MPISRAQTEIFYTRLWGKNRGKYRARAHVEYYDQEGKTNFVGLFFDGQEFVCDKEDLVAIDDILKTVMDGLADPHGVDQPLINREIVMNSV